MSESAKLRLGLCSTMYSIVSIVTKTVLGKYQGKSQCCMLLVTSVYVFPDTEYFPTLSASKYKQNKGVNTYLYLMLLLVVSASYNMQTSSVTTDIHQK